MNNQTPQKPINELKGFELFKRSQVTRELVWNRNGYWTNKGWIREPGKFCGDCVTELTEVRKSRTTVAHLKCNDCGKEIGKRELTKEEHDSI